MARLNRALISPNRSRPNVKIKNGLDPEDEGNILDQEHTIAEDRGKVAKNALRFPGLALVAFLSRRLVIIYPAPSSTAPGA